LVTAVGKSLMDVFTPYEYHQHSNNNSIFGVQQILKSTLVFALVYSSFLAAIDNPTKLSNTYYILQKSMFLTSFNHPFFY